MYILILKWEYFKHQPDTKRKLSNSKMIQYSVLTEIYIAEIKTSDIEWNFRPRAMFFMLRTRRHHQEEDKRQFLLSHSGLIWTSGRFSEACSIFPLLSNFGFALIRGSCLIKVYFKRASSIIDLWKPTGRQDNKTNDVKEITFKKLKKKNNSTI